MRGRFPAQLGTPSPAGRRRGRESLLAVGMFERQWRPFDLEISRVKLELVDYLKRGGKGTYDLADCEIKSNWIRHQGARAKHSSFLDSLDPDDYKLVATYYRQISARKIVLRAAVIDKRELYPNTTHDALHKKAYEFMLERIEHYMRTYHLRHQALIVMDNTQQATQSLHHVAARPVSAQRQPQHALPAHSRVSLLHSERALQRRSASRLDGLQRLPSLQGRRLRLQVLPANAADFYRRPRSNALDSLKVWPDASPLASEAWSRFGATAASDVGLG